jgi:hypothetical protein
MRQLEADQLAEETTLNTSPPSKATNSSSGNGTTSAPSTPPGADVEIPQSKQAGGAAGAKSMPTSRRASGYGGSAFGMEKLSLSVMEPNVRADGERSWLEPDEDDVDAEGAQSEFYLCCLKCI